MGRLLYLILVNVKQDRPGPSHYYQSRGQPETPLSVAAPTSKAEPLRVSKSAEPLLARRVFKGSSCLGETWNHDLTTINDGRAVQNSTCWEIQKIPLCVLIVCF